MSHDRDGISQCSFMLSFCREDLLFRCMLEQRKLNKIAIIYQQTTSRGNDRKIGNYQIYHALVCFVHKSYRIETEMKDKVICLKISYLTKLPIFLNIILQDGESQPSK